MQIDNPLDMDDNRGVSPVIGVILMVAITVILAAVIGAFVLDLGSNLGSTGPQTQLTVSDASDEIDGSGDAVVALEHKGGDKLNTDNLKVIVSNDSVSPSTDGPLEFVPTGEFTVGETVMINESSAAINASGTYTVKVIHTPSQSVLLSSEVEVQ